MTPDDLRAIRERNEERKRWIADGCGGIELEEPQTADIDTLLAEVERLQGGSFVVVNEWLCRHDEKK